MVAISRDGYRHKKRICLQHTYPLNIALEMVTAQVIAATIVRAKMQETLIADEAG
jgi:hypothetical protein